MPIHTQHESNNLYVIRFSGLIRSAEFGANQERLAREIDTGAQPRILAILEDFEGWEKGVDWNDFDFQFSYAGEIARIALVGDPRWETEALAFAGAGFRKAPVKFFPPDQEAAARAWVEL